MEFQSHLQLHQVFPHSIFLPFLYTAIQRDSLDLEQESPKSRLSIWNIP
ncbi:hypothetical protein F383_26684 [Gossypium arboreum]|uniref:Uncharacterized protein n=1 Tax=Gossypium arboreum TaxID=29729 RepID=A0A0B0P549_GOSAR|nr:hypothetical protein F383_26684 [Gossypium arboreum]